MARLIADGEVRITFAPTVTDPAAPTVAQVETAATDLTPFLSSLDTPLDGEAVPSSDLSDAFNKTVPGTFGGEMIGELYRDDTADVAWTLLPRNTLGYVVIRRFGGSDVAIVATDVVEVWPVRVITRSPSPLSRGAVQMFNVNMATLDSPSQDVVVA